MKKIYLFTFLMAGFLGYAQFSENFDTSTTLPLGWIAFRGTNGIGPNQDWQITTDKSHSAPNSAYVRYESVADETLAEDWLVTPMIDLTNRAAATLTFYGGQYLDADWFTVYEVRISTTSQTLHDSFTMVATFAEVDFPFSELPELVTQKSIDLSAFDGEQIYIAFVMTQNDGDNWYIDDVNVTSTLGLADQTGNFKTVVYPNPTTGIFSIKASETIENIEVYSILGNKIGTYKDEMTIDLSQLASGTYIAKITSTEGNVSRQKLVKN